MPFPTLTALYAGLLAVVLLALSIWVVRLRWRFQQGLGDGGHPELRRATRAHANFAEYVPLCLLLILFVELSRWPSWTVHALGAALVVGRILHPWGLSRSDNRTAGRAWGVTLTFSVLAAGAIMALVSAFQALA